MNILKNILLLNFNETFHFLIKTFQEHNDNIKLKYFFLFNFINYLNIV